MSRMGDEILEDIYFEYTTDKSPISYKAGDVAVAKLRLLNGNLEYAVPLIKWRWNSDGGMSSSGAESNASCLEIKIPIIKEGFTHLVVEACDEEGTRIANSKPFDGGIGADISNIRLATPIPSDFDERWAAWKEELRDVPLKVLDIKEINDSDVPNTHKLFDIKISCAGPMPVSGFLTYPKDACEKSLPIYLQGRGYGLHSAVRLFNDSLTLHLNAHGFLNEQPEEYYKSFGAKFKNSDYGFDNAENSDPETCYFKYMMLRALRGFEYLKTHPLWNGKDAVVGGGSQGAFQAIAVAAHDSAVTRLDIEIPWMSNIYNINDGYIRGWRPDNANGLCYFDEAVQATRVVCKTKITAGLGDYISPPSTVAALYNSLRSTQKELHFFQDMVHESFVGKTDEYVIDTFK